MLGGGANDTLPPVPLLKGGISGIMIYAAMCLPRGPF